MTVEHISVPANDKVFIDSVIRNTSLAVRDNVLDSDDENEDSDVDTSGNESGDDVCIIVQTIALLAVVMNIIIWNHCLDYRI